MLLSKIVLIGAISVSGAAMANVQGLYQSACIAAPEPGLSLQNSVNFGKTTARQVQVIYGDETCTQGAWAFDFRGPFTLDENGALNLTASTLQLMPLEATIAASFNEVKLCGLSNWQLNKAKDIAGLDCSGTQIPDAGSVSYDIIKEVDGGIVFGELSMDLDGSSADKRPTGFDTANVFKAVEASEEK